MFKPFRFPFILFLSIQFFIKCANPLTPTGGEKDTIPPSLVSSYPISKSLNFDDSEIILEFDENINADKLKTSLIITPLTDLEYTYIIRKNRITLKLQQDLEDSTTYSFNFFNGITDNTEKNPAENLVLAFSTGDYIDSLRVSGTVKDLLTQKSAKGILVGLYLYTDTLDLFKEKPRYFTTTDKEGSFTIENIKNDVYKLLAFHDENNNATFDPAIEAHGFIPGHIILNENADSLQVFTQLIDVSTFNFISARPFANTFDIRYNKEIIEYKIIAIDSSQIPPASILSQEKNTIKLYNTENLTYSTDSIGLIIQVKDTIDSQLQDTIYARFQESSRKPADLIINPSISIDINDSVYCNIKFNKPIDLFKPQLIAFKADTIFNQLLDSSTQFNWNFNRTEFQFSTYFDWSLYNDSINNYIENIILDTLSNDTSFQYIERSFENVELVFPSGTFHSVIQDTSYLISQKITRLDKTQLGVLRLNINTEYPSFIGELTSNKKQVFTYRNEIDKTFNTLPPGSYTIKYFIDLNQDGFWTPGNLIKDIPPEPVYIYPESTALRANWELTIDDIQF